jgi:hypothetical protein
LVRNENNVSSVHAVRARRLRMLRKKWSDLGRKPVLRTGRLQIEDGNGRLRGVFATGGPLGSGVHPGSSSPTRPGRSRKRPRSLRWGTQTN